MTKNKKQYLCDVITQYSTYFIDLGFDLERNEHLGHEAIDLNPSRKEHIKGKVYAIFNDDLKTVKELRIIF